MDKSSSINLVAIQRPTAASPILRRRSKFIASLDLQLQKIEVYRSGKRVSKEAFWIDGDGKTVLMSLRYGKQPLELSKGKSTLRAVGGFNDLVTQLQEVQKIAFAGGLDDELAACANSVRQNFKTARDRKTGKG